jgi:hypothetical protein
MKLSDNDLEEIGYRLYLQHVPDSRSAYSGGIYRPDELARKLRS